MLVKSNLEAKLLKVFLSDFQNILTFVMAKEVAHVMQTIGLGIRMRKLHINFPARFEISMTSAKLAGSSALMYEPAKK